MCVAFTGYRPEKMLAVSRDPALAEHVATGVRAVIIELYESGERTFMSGMAEGFDMIAAEQVLRLIDEGTCPEAHLVAVIPYRGQPRNYPEPSRRLYDELCAGASERIVLSERYHHDCFFVRNDYLVDHSSVLVCFYDGQSGGTRYTVRRATAAGLRIINMLDNTLF